MDGGAAARMCMRHSMHSILNPISVQLLQADLVLWTAGSQPASRGNDSHSAPERPGISLPFPRNGRVSS